MDDRENLPSNMRTLYAPSYNHYCTPSGHMPLPADFANGFVAERVSEFPQDRQVQRGFAVCDC